MHLQPPRMEKLNMELETRGFTVYMAARAGQHRIQEPYFYLKISGKETEFMAFFTSAITILQTLVVALGAGLAVWGVINLLEGYGNDNPGAKSQGIKQFMAN